MADSWPVQTQRLETWAYVVRDLAQDLDLLSDVRAPLIPLHTSRSNLITRKTPLPSARKNGYFQVLSL
jgi:hypothetical protein